MQSVDRAALLIEAVAHAGSPEQTSAAALAAACGLNRATAWRILSTLEEHGFVECDRSTGHWSVGSGLVDVARAATARDPLRGVRPVLERLAQQSGETAALAVWRQGSLTYIDEAAPAAVVAATWEGRSVSLHGTSTGKVLLAWSSEPDRERLLAAGLERHTPTTITDRAALVAELEVTRRRGWATCAGEYDPAAYGVSAPVLDRRGSLLAVLSIWGPQGRVTPDRFDHLGALTAQAAASLSEPRD